MDLAEMFTPRRSSRKITLPSLDVIVGKGGAVSLQWQTDMIPVGNLTATRLDDKAGDWLQVLREEVDLKREGAPQVRLMDLVGVRQELWPETLTDAQKEHIAKASEQIWGDGTQDQQLSSDGFFSWMKEAGLDGAYKGLMGEVASSADVTLGQCYGYGRAY